MNERAHIAKVEPKTSSDHLIRGTSHHRFVGCTDLAKIDDIKADIFCFVVLYAVESASTCGALSICDVAVDSHNVAVPYNILPTITAHVKLQTNPFIARYISRPQTHLQRANLVKKIQMMARCR